MNNLLAIEARNVYGNVLYYPVNEQAKKLAVLLGTKSLTRESIRQAIFMGFEVEAIGWTLSSNEHVARTFAQRDQVGA